MWLILALSAYFLNAIAATVDKILISKSIPEPKAYTFFISVLGFMVVAVYLPFSSHITDLLVLPTMEQALIAMGIGVCGTMALLSFFTALKYHEASRVVPLVGGIQPFILLVFAYGVLHENLTQAQVMALGMFIIGGFLIGYDAHAKGGRNGKKWLIYVILAGVFFALFHGMTKLLYMRSEFIQGFIWPRITTMILALLFLLQRDFRILLKRLRTRTASNATGLFIFGQLCGGGFFILLNYAISIGSVTLINALQGIQYIFVFIMASALSVLYPKLMGETMRPIVLFQKIIGILLIGFGILFVV